MSDGILRRAEDWSTKRRGYALLIAAAVGMAVSTTLLPDPFDVVVHAAAVVGVAGVYVYEASTRERCEECDEQVYSALRYCDSCGYETGCDHDVFKEDGPICPVCGEEQ